MLRVRDDRVEKRCMCEVAVGDIFIYENKYFIRINKTEEGGNFLVAVNLMSGIMNKFPYTEKVEVINAVLTIEK